MPSETKRKLRSNIDGQEDMVDALWDFAREIVALNGDHSFADRARPVSKGQMDAIGRAMERISAGYGYRIVGIE